MPTDAELAQREESRAIGGLYDICRDADEIKQIESDWEIVDDKDVELDLPVARFINGCTGLDIEKK